MRYALIFGVKTAQNPKDPEIFTELSSFLNELFFNRFMALVREHGLHNHSTIDSSGQNTAGLSPNKTWSRYYVLLDRYPALIA